MLRKVTIVTIAVLGLTSLTAATAAEAGSCPYGYLPETTRFCVPNLLGLPFCQDLTTCQRIILHVPHKLPRHILPPPQTRPSAGTALHGHPVLKMR